MWKPLLQTLLLLTVLCLAAEMPNVQAQTVSTSVSHGNLIYEGKRGSAALYAEDIHLLEEKISTIPERCFDPVCYAHTHNWEYYRINKKAHTRHCADCGDSNDLTSPHRADSWEHDTIFYEGKAYPGKRFTCACGYQWSMELSHTMIFEAVDEVTHQGRCALDGSPYCRGCEPIVEEHYAWYYEMGGDESHHEKICFDCGFRIEEICRFEETEDAPEEPDTSDSSGTEDAPDTPEEPGTEDAPETPEEPGTEDTPETPEEPETEDAPEESETSDLPETEDTPEEAETPEQSGTGDAPDTAQTEELEYVSGNRFD